MSTIKRFFLCFFCVLIVLTSFIFPASAVSADFYFNVPDPSSVSDGYIIVPFLTASGNPRALLYWWTITPVLTDVDSTGNLVTTVDYSSNGATFTFVKSVSASSVSYYVTLYEIYDGPNSTPGVIRSGIVSNSSNLTYTFGFSTQTLLNPTAFSGIEDLNLYTNDSMDSNNFNYLYADNNAFYSELVEINNNLSSLIQNSSLSAEAIETLVSNTNKILTNLSSLNDKSVLTNEKLTSILNQLNQVISHFTSLLTKVDYTNEQLETVIEYFGWLLDSVYNIEYSLSEFVFYYWQEFADNTFPIAINNIISRLDKIYNLLNKEGKVEQTTADTSKVDNYVDIEQSLVNNDEAKSAVNDMDVSISGKAYSFIWDLITRILNSHPEVFGLIIAILTLGFIALLLNR